MLLVQTDQSADDAERDLGLGQSALRPISVPDRLQGEGRLEPLVWSGHPVCTENLIRVDAVMESSKLAG
jgi:hypothetical protein